MLRNQFSSIREFAQNFIKMVGWEENPAINGAFIVGSVASNCSDSMSDLDIVVLAELPPSDALRLNDYQRIGCRKAMIGFFQKDAPQLNSNVLAIDKVWLDDLQVDISFCTEKEAAVYNYQPIIVLKPSPAIEALQPAAHLENVQPNSLEERLRYDFRILEVHRDRYERWCLRKKWLNIDLSRLLFAIRDIALVLNGYWQYNSANPYFWNVLENVETSVPGLSKTLEDIKELDDRSAFKLKLSLIDSLTADLRNLCSSREILVQLYDIDNPYSQ